MRKYQYWLSNIPGIGNRTIHHLIQMYGDAREVYFSKESRLQAVPKLSKTQQESILESKKTWDLERQEEKLQESLMAGQWQETKKYEIFMMHHTVFIARGNSRIKRRKALPS